jgi:DNA-binding response OmpR family regulator
MVSALTSERMTIDAMLAGADDYISKPFSPREVVARVRTVLRRSGGAAAASKIIRMGDLEIEIDGHTVARAGNVLDLTRTEFDLLVTLASQPGRVFSRLQLLEAVQGQAYEGYERTIDAHIKNLRAKVETNPREPRFIETVFGVGYRFRKDTDN